MGERNLILSVFILSLLSFIFLFSSNFYSWIFKGEKVFLETILKILSRNILNVISFLMGIIIPLSFLKSTRFLISWSLLFFLLVPIILDISIKNTYRWITFYDFTIQPSEIFKIGFLLQISNFLSEPKNPLRVSGFLTYFLLALIFLYLIPHFSMIVSIIFVTGTLIFLKGIKFKYFLIAFIILPLLLFSLIFIKKSYVMSRIKSYRSGEVVYQVKQAKIAISRGGIFGVGIGKGKIKYKFLPDLSKDFIFSLIAEETGFLGISILIFIYLVLIKSLIDNALLIEDEFFKTYVLGTVIFTFFNVFVHISVNLGILPVTGVPLPLISYGGSSGITYSFLFGSCYNIIANREILKEEKIELLWSRYS
ncbi:MAG: FtsW/RodA/SpoVE family cell cycle protein [candidate division WOR-3 bacterium]